MATSTDPSSRVRESLRAAEVEARVVEFDASTRTARDAATALGCSVAQIAKSLIFRTTATGSGVLVIASGTNRVDESLVGELLGTPIEKADADFVRAVTGFAIGGVAPTGLLTPLPTFIDSDLGAFATIWAAAGTPRHVMELEPADLVTLTGGTVAAIC